MIEAPATSVITIDGQAIEYPLERRRRRTVLILHGGHMSARCGFGEDTFLDAGYSVLVASECAACRGRYPDSPALAR